MRTVLSYIPVYCAALNSIQLKETIREKHVAQARPAGMIQPVVGLIDAVESVEATPLCRCPAGAIRRIYATSRLQRMFQI